MHRFTRAITCILAFAAAAAAIAENPAAPVTQLNRIAPKPTLPYIQIDGKLHFRNSADRVALADELGIAGGVVGVTSIGGHNGTVALADLGLDQVSVKDYGAVGDGTTDDTAAIQAALDTKATLIYLPPGTYKTTSTLFGDSFQNVFGAGINYDGAVGTTLHYTGTTGAAIQFPRAFDVAGVATSATSPTVTTVGPHGLSVDDAVQFDFITGATCTPSINGPFFKVATVVDAHHFTIKQLNGSDVNCSVASTPNTGQGSSGFARMSRLGNLRLLGDDAANDTAGVRFGIGNLAYAANSFTVEQIYVTGFGVGLDNLNADASRVINCGFATNGINLQTNCNDRLLITGTSNNDASTYGVYVWGGGATMIGGVSGLNPCHVLVANGLSFSAEGVWFEAIKSGGSVAYIDCGSNTRVTFRNCHKQTGGADLPFIHSFGNVDLGIDELDFACLGIAPLGHGQTGTLNGDDYTASGYNAPASVDLATMMRGTLPVANGGTGQTTAQAALDALAAASGALSSGDTFFYNGSHVVRLAKGSDSQVLTVDPSTHLPVWSTPSSNLAGSLFGGGYKSWPLSTSNWTIHNTVDAGVEGIGMLVLHAGITTGGSAIAVTGAPGGNSSWLLPGQNLLAGDMLNWGQRYRLFFLCNVEPGTIDADSAIWFHLGDPYNQTVPGDLATKGIGLKISNTAFVAECHDGTTRTTNTLTGSLTTGQGLGILLDYDGAGTLSVYINGTLAGTCTGGPTSNSANGNTALTVGVGNGAGTKFVQLYLANVWSLLGN